MVILKAQELLELKLKDILEKYCIVMSAECDYVYGITTQKDVNKLSEKWNLQDEPSFVAEPIIPIDYLVEIEENETILTEKMMDELIENNLLIERKEKTNQ